MTFYVSFGLATMMAALSSISSAVPAAAAAPQLKYDTYTTFEALQQQKTRECLIESHDCEVCSVDGLEKVSCSSVGTACEPKEWRCMYLVRE